MTDLGDENKLGSDNANIVGERQQSVWTWKDLAPVLLLALVGPVFVPVMMLIKPDYEMVLFQNPMGLKMLGFAIVQQLIGMAAHISWMLWGSKRAPRWLSALIAVLVVVVFYLPFMFVVFIGPAAIAIHERLQRP